VTDNQKIHLAEIPPTHCTSCFAQVPLKRHVDFSAYYDGPVFGDIEIVGGGKVVIDDLILCEDCVKAAAQLIGLDDVERHCEEIQTLKAELEQARQQVVLALTGVQKVEAAHADLEALKAMIPQRKTRQKAAA
jgi:hypothetical protein